MAQVNEFDVVVGGYHYGPVEDDELDGYRDWERAFDRDESSRGSPPAASWLRRLFRRGGSPGH